MENTQSYVLCIDEGTTSSRVALIDRSLKIIAFDQAYHEQICPQPGWTEHDPLEIYNNVVKSIDKLYETHGDRFTKIKAVAITNQRETCLAWDRQTGEPLCNAIVWHDMRTSGIVDTLVEKYGRDSFVDTCGLPITTYFSALKMKWMIDNVKPISDRVNSGDTNLCFGTIDSWLVYVRPFITF
jgi:glycerol kinase